MSVWANKTPPIMKEKDRSRSSRLVAVVVVSFGPICFFFSKGFRRVGRFVPTNKVKNVPPGPGFSPGFLFSIRAFPRGDVRRGGGRTWKVAPPSLRWSSLPSQLIIRALSPPPPSRLTKAWAQYLPAARRDLEAGG